LEAGFLGDFADEAVFDGFVEFEDAAGGFPASVIGAADDEEASLVVEDRGGDADGVSRRLLGGAHGAARLRVV
jgi:hypothetical protein